MNNIVLHIVVICCVMLGAVSGTAQARSTGRWQVDAVRVNAEEVMVTFCIKLDSGWYLYSRHAPVKEVALQFSFSESADYMIKENIREESPVVEKFDSFFQRYMPQLNGTAYFSQRVKLKKPVTVVKGSIYFVVRSEHSQPVKEVLHFSVAATTNSTVPKTTQVNN